MTMAEILTFRDAPRPEAPRRAAAPGREITLIRSKRITPEVARALAELVAAAERQFGTGAREESRAAAPSIEVADLVRLTGS